MEDMSDMERAYWWCFRTILGLLSKETGKMESRIAQRNMDCVICKKPIKPGQHYIPCSYRT